MVETASSLYIYIYIYIYIYVYIYIYTHIFVVDRFTKENIFKESKANVFSWVSSAGFVSRFLPVPYGDLS